MIRILQCVNNMHRAGLETMLMNYYRNIDREKIQFDFLMHRQERSDYDDEIESLGGRIYRAPRLYPQNYPAYFQYMKQFFRDHPEYKIIHSHIDAMSYLPLLAGKLAGIPVRIAHSHSTSIDRDMKYLMKQCFRFGIPSVATHYLACGEAAGHFLYRGRDFQIICNAIDPSKFYYCPEVREAKRKELGLEKRYVLGHVGRFCYPKNHEFLVKIFAEVLKKEQTAVLMLVGTGEKEEKILELVDRLGISDSVRFMGSRNDVHELYQAMDVFVMPSLFEGVPLVGIEAQFSGLPCVFSERVPQEVMFTKDCTFLELGILPEKWAEQIIICRNRNRQDMNIENPKYDVTKVSAVLSDIYLQMSVQELSEK